MISCVAGEMVVLAPSATKRRFQLILIKP